MDGEQSASAVSGRVPQPQFALDLRVDDLERKLEQAFKRIRVLEHQQAFDEAFDTQEDSVYSRVKELERKLDLVLQRIRKLEKSSSLDSPDQVVPVEQSQSDQDQAGQDRKADFSEPDAPSPKTSKRSSTLVEAQDAIADLTRAVEGHELKPNCWEASILIGEPHVGAAGTFFLVFGMLVSVIGEVLFVYVLTFTEKCFIRASRPGNDILKRWRYTIGHDQKNMIGANSLLSAVCAQSPLLTMATAQAELVKNMDAYVTNIMGGILATLVIGMWFLKVGEELQECWSFMTGIMLLKRAKKTEFELDHDDNQIEMTSISYPRLALVMLLSLVRMTVAIALFGVGALWLAAEIDIENLVLNAASLEFVMSLDELLFYHFAPEHAKVVIRHASKLPGVQHKSWRGVNLGPAIMLILTVTSVTLYVTILVGPQILDINLARKILCQGDMQFVYIDMDYFPQRATSSEADSHNIIIQRTADYNIEFLEQYSFRASDAPPTWLSASELDKAVEAGALSLYPRRCEDHLDLHTVELRLDVVDFVPFFKAYSGLTDVGSCEALSDFCYAPTAFWVRFLCPKTCGCDLYPGSLWIRTGCPQTCEENDAYWQQEMDLPCKDTEKAALQIDPVWRSWWIGNWTPWYNDQWPEGFAAQEVPGCGILAGNESGLLPELLCAYGDAAQFSGSLRLFCPETCGCNHSTEGCPETCIKE